MEFYTRFGSNDWIINPLRSHRSSSPRFFSLTCLQPNEQTPGYQSHLLGVRGVKRGKRNAMNHRTRVSPVCEPTRFVQDMFKSSDGPESMSGSSKRATIVGNRRQRRRVDLCYQSKLAITTACPNHLRPRQVSRSKSYKMWTSQRHTINMIWT